MMRLGEAPIRDARVFHQDMLSQREEIRFKRDYHVGDLARRKPICHKDAAMKADRCILRKGKGISVPIQ